MFCPTCQGGTRRFGWNRNGSQRHRCDACKKTFTDGQTRPQDRHCTDPAKMLTIMNQILEGASIRSQERIYHVGRNTILAAIVEAGEKCKKFLDAKIVGVPVEDVECDEIWGFVGMKEKTRVLHQAPECFGDVWCFTAIERNTKLLLTHHVGKRRTNDAVQFAENLARATSGQFH